MMSENQSQEREMTDAQRATYSRILLEEGAQAATQYRQDLRSVKPRTMRTKDALHLEREDAAWEDFGTMPNRYGCDR